jgi:hypothetical protein
MVETCALCWYHLWTRHQQCAAYQDTRAVPLVEPVHTDNVVMRHGVRHKMIRARQLNIQQARKAHQTIRQAVVTSGLDVDAPMKLAILQNKVAQGEFAANIEVPVELTDSKKTQFSIEWWTYRELNENLAKHKGQEFSLIQVQCTQLLQDKMKQDPDWITVSTAYDPLTLYRLIERTVSVQTEDQYPFTTVYDQELLFYSSKQESLSNPQWCEGFNTKVDVRDAIGVTHQHKVLLEYVAHELHSQAFGHLAAAEQLIVRDDAKERYVLYDFLCQSGTQHGNLKVDLQNDFTTGDNCYRKNHQQTLHLLDKYSNTVVARATQSEGTSFAQIGGRGVGRGRSSEKSEDSNTYDKKWWKNKECYKCHKKRHPATHCPKKSAKEDDDRSLVSNTISVDKLKKDIKSMKKACTTVNTQLALLKEADSEISDPEGDEEALHFQMDEALQFTQVDKGFKPRIARLFKKNHGSKIKLDLG